MMNYEFEVSVRIPQEVTDQILSAVSMAVRDTADMVKLEWEKIARQKLKGAYADYEAALNRPDSLVFPDPFTAVITLRGKWANMLETGFPAFDMKKGFQKSEKAKRTAKGGWYLTIPFRHQTPGTVGVGGGRPMPQDIYRMARTLQTGERLTGTETKYPPQMSWTLYINKSGIYEGMIRNTMRYSQSGAVQGTYYTFRRVSDKSDPLSWWHPGFDGVHAMNHLKPMAEQWLQNNIAYHLSRLG